jgi:hypothetical protein
MEPKLFRPVILRPRLSVGFAVSVRAVSYASASAPARKFVTPQAKSAIVPRSTFSSGGEELRENAASEHEVAAGGISRLRALAEQLHTSPAECVITRTRYMRGRSVQVERVLLERVEWDDLEHFLVCRFEHDARRLARFPRLEPTHRVQAPAIARL